MAPSAISPRTHVSVPGPAVSGMWRALTECCWPQQMIWGSPLSALWISNRGPHSVLVHDAASCRKFHKDNSLGAVELTVKKLELLGFSQQNGVLTGKT